MENTHHRLASFTIPFDTEGIEEEESPARKLRGSKLKTQGAGSVGVGDAVADAVGDPVADAVCMGDAVADTVANAVGVAGRSALA